jgi:hypothetical protein
MMRSSASSHGVQVIRYRRDALHHSAVMLLARTSESKVQRKYMKIVRFWI